MPETTTAERAWRTDAADGRGASPTPGAAMRAASGLRRLCERLRSAWSRSRGAGRDRFEEAFLSFATALASSNDPDVIEAALAELAGRIAPGGRVERIRATGMRPRADGSPVADEGGFEEFRLRCGAADHGRLRLHVPAAGARPEVTTRMAIACTMAASALEVARLRADWCWEPGDSHDGEGEAAPRSPRPGRGVVRDATFLNAVLPFALEQSRRYGEPVSLVCARLDRLGAISELNGAATADRLVQELGELIASLVRASDLVVRLDDDRIVALLVRARGDGAMKVARTIGQAVADVGLGSPRFPGATASIGVAEFPVAARDAAALLDAADEAMSIAHALGDHAPVLARPRAARDREAVPLIAMHRMAEAPACGT